MRTTLPQRTSAALALALTLFTSTVAHAGDPSPDAIEKSSALYKQARALQVRGKWPEAEAAYQAAWDLRRTFDIAGNLGDCELHVGQPREAAEHLAFALKNLPAGVTPEQTEALRGLLKQAQQGIGTLRITVNLGGAQLVVDGQPIEGTGGEVFVAPGVRTIEARLAGYAAVQKTVSVGAGASEKVELVLVAQRGPSKAVVVVGGVIGGAGLVTGAVLLGVSAAKGSTVSALQDKVRHEGGCAGAVAGSDCTTLRSAGGSKATLGNAGFWMLVTGGAVGAATLIYVVASGAKAAPPKSAWQVLPVATGDGGGLLVLGSF